MSSLVFAVLACTPPPPPKTNDVPPSDSSEPDKSVQVAPVPAPAGIIAKGRAKNLGATLRVVSSLVGAPPENAEATGRAVVADFIARGLRLEIDPSFADHIALEAPVDLAAATSEGDVIFAVSIGLASLDGAKSAAGANLAEVAPGMWALGGERAKGACAIFQSAGATPGRLVCGRREQEVATLGPYLARTVAAEPPPSQDITAELDIAGINERLGPTLRKVAPALPVVAAKRYGIGNDRFDNAIEELARFLLNDAGLLLGDAKKLRLEGMVDPAKGIDVKLRLDLDPASKSWFARTALATSSSKVPDILWKAPADASGAVFATVVDPAAFGDITKALKGMIAGGLESAKVGSDAERKKVSDLLDLPIAKGAGVVGLGGFGRVTKAAEPKNAKEKQQAHFDRLMGWYLIGTSQKSDAWAKWLKDSAAAFNQPGMQKAMKKMLGKDEKVSLATAPPPKELGKGAAQLNVSFSSKVDQDISAEGVLFVLLMPDGDNTWIGMGFDRGEIIQRLLRVRDGVDALKDRKDLASLRQGNATAGAFITLQSFRSSVYAMTLLKAAQQNPKADVATEALRQTDALFAGLPQKGLAPMFMRTSVTQNQLGVDVTIDKLVLDDVSTVVRAFTGRR